jgi:hypothetical protein
MPGVKDTPQTKFEGATLESTKNARLNTIAGKPDLGYTIASTKQGSNSGKKGEINRTEGRFCAS